jgi:hypothetical protein
MEDYNQLAYNLRKPLAPYLLPFTSDNLANYTPTYVGGTTAGATTYSVQQGQWWRFGPLVFVTGTVAWTAATGTGNARISLPFTCANVANQNFGGSLFISGVTFANGTPQILISPNTAYFIMTSPLTNAANTTVAVEAAGTVAFSVWYALE